MRNKINFFIIIIGFISFILLLSFSTILFSETQIFDNTQINYSNQKQNNQEDSLEKVKVTKIKDGDTFDIERKIIGVDENDIPILINEIDTVRLILTNTPEKDKEPYWDKAVEKLEEIIKENKGIVYLEKDENNREGYGRLLRYVWLDYPNYEGNFENELLEKNINAILIREGLARVWVVNDSKYVDYFYEFKAKAMEDKKGMWAKAECEPFIKLEIENSDVIIRLVNIKKEFVILENKSEQGISLNGWKLITYNKKKYDYLKYDINGKEKLKIPSEKLNNNGITLFLCNDENELVSILEEYSTYKDYLFWCNIIKTKETFKPCKIE